MFDIELEGKPPIRESDFIEPGKEIVPPFDTAVGKVGMAICFDLRFPEIALRLKRLGAEVLLYPSAFTVPTGKAHWEALLRGRAIECQCYVSVIVHFISFPFTCLFVLLTAIEPIAVLNNLVLVQS